MPVMTSRVPEANVGGSTISTAADRMKSPVTQQNVGGTTADRLKSRVTHENVGRATADRIKSRATAESMGVVSADRMKSPVTHVGGSTPDRMKSRANEERVGVATADRMKSPFTHESVGRGTGMGVATADRTKSQANDESVGGAMVDRTKEPVIIRFDTKWDSVHKLLPMADTKPVILNKSSVTNTTNPFGSSFCYGVEDIIFEVTANQHIASVILYPRIRKDTKTIATMGP